MTNKLQAFSDEMADLVEGAAASVLRVEARRRLPATGIAWSEDLIVTAHHVVETDEDIGIGFADGGRVNAELVGRDPRHDLALLRVESTLSPANWAEAQGLRAGNLVLALGRPRQNINATLGLVTGVVSAERRRKRMKLKFEKGRKGGMKQWKGEWKGRKWRKRLFWDGGGMGFAPGGFIRSDVLMYPGFSGGPLLGADGAIHGMNTSGFGAGASLALPVAAIAKSVAALLQDGKIASGYLGVGVQAAALPAPVAEELDQEAGLLIVSIEPDSPAAQAGALVGDILTALADEPVEEIDELQALLARIPVGSEVNTQYVRGGVLQEGRVRIGAN